MMTVYAWAMVATNRPDSDGERFSDEALEIIHKQAWDMPIRVNFEGDPVGKIMAAALSVGDKVEVLAAGELQLSLYVVPQFAFDRKTVTEEDGVKVYHEIKLMGFGLTDNPSDPHLTPLKVPK